MSIRSLAFNSEQQSGTVRIRLRIGRMRGLNSSILEQIGFEAPRVRVGRERGLDILCFEADRVRVGRVRGLDILRSEGRPRSRPRRTRV